MSTVMNKLTSSDKMTKSYLKETNSFLKTNGKSFAFSNNSNENVVDHHNTEWFGENDMSMLDDEHLLLTSNNVPLNMPPIAYMNSNGVRPVRRRHFSQQQTGLSEDDKGFSSNDQLNNEISPSIDLEISQTMRNEAKKPHDITKHRQHQLVSNYSNNDLFICDPYDNNEKSINHLAKGIEKVLRLAKESRRLNCTELLVPHMLMAHIAVDVIELAECEPCGLRGCLLLICIEDNSNENSIKHQKSPNSMNRNLSPSSRLLGEFAIDSNVVPTFEVFLTLKRVEPSWFESLENLFFKKAQIILSEVYLLNKKKLYQPSSPAL